MTRFRVLFAVVLAALLGVSAPAAGAATGAVSTRRATVSTTLYAADETHQTVVRFVPSATGGTSAVIGRNLDSVYDLSSDATGNVYLLDNGRLVRISSDGVQRSVAANLTDLRELVVDRQGTVFVADAHRVIRIYQPSGKQTVLGSIGSATIDGLGVDGSGRPTAAYPDDDDNLVLATFSTTAGKPATIRTTGEFDNGNVIRGLVEAPTGAVFYNAYATGGSGVHDVARINAGSRTPTRVNTRYSDYAWTVDPQVRVHLMQIRTWCFTPAEGDGSCTKNYAVDEILVFPDTGGTPRSVPTSKLTLPRGGIAVSADQTTYAALDGGVVRIPAAGGEPKPVVSGSYTGLTVQPGT